MDNYKELGEQFYTKSGIFSHQKWLSLSPEEKIQNTVYATLGEYIEKYSYGIDNFLKGEKQFKHSSNYVVSHAEPIIKLLGKDFIPNSVALILSLYIINLNDNTINIDELKKINEFLEYINQSKRTTTKDVIRYAKLWIELNKKNELGSGEEREIGEYLEEDNLEEVNLEDDESDDYLEDDFEDDNVEEDNLDEEW